jgi:DNA-binding response OmpR family regulator
MRYRVLIVEDDVPTAIDLEETLQEEGFRTVGPAFDRVEAAQLMNEGAIDAAVLDPRVLGDDCRELVGRLDATGVPVFYLTGMDGPAVRREVSSSRVILKPCSSGQVARRVRLALAA